jgi:MazG family protein
MDPDRLPKAFVDLVDLVVRLRGPGGCPWDAEQTDSTIKLYLLEEAYEVLEAIEKSSPLDVCLELGDLLFHILLLAQLAEERKEFDFVEVVERITEKMIRRHPHVFGKTKVDNAEDVALNWAMIKKEEKGDPKDTSSLLKDVPVNLPALLKAHRLNERASKVDFDWPNADAVWDEVLEKFEELSAAVSRQDRDLFSEEMGDLLFSLANLARHWGFNSEHLLRVANRKFLDHFEKIEATTQVHGLPASGGARGDQGSRLETDED